MSEINQRPKRSTRGQVLNKTEGAPVESSPKISPESENHDILKKKRRFTSSQKKIAAGMIMALGLGMFSYQPVMNYIVGPRALEKAYAESTSQEEIQANVSRFLNEDAENLSEHFDYNDVTTMTALDAKPSVDKSKIVGGVYVPSVSMTMPIQFGVSQKTLLSSAGTLKPDQYMGFGNYAIIGHNSKNPKVLFAPVHRIEMGDTIYLSDKRSVYVYKTTNIKVVEPTEVSVKDDVPGTSMVTLITCTADSKRRLVVQGTIVSTYAMETAPEDVRAAFNDL